MKNYKLHISEGYNDTYGLEMLVKKEIENCTIKTEKNYGTGGDYIRRIYKKEFDATDWFPKTFTCEAGGFKYKYNIKKIVGNLA